MITTKERDIAPILTCDGCNLTVPKSADSAPLAEAEVAAVVAEVVETEVSFELSVL